MQAYIKMGLHKCGQNGKYFTIAAKINTLLGNTPMGAKNFFWKNIVSQASDFRDDTPFYE